MRKYEFRPGDTVREITVDKKPIIGRVIGSGSSAEHDFYRIQSRGEIYSARDDEIELVRRAPSKHDAAGLIDKFVLDWYGPDRTPAAGEECMLAWIGFDGEWREDVARWNGEEWEFTARGSSPGTRIGMEVVDAWAPWEWPSVSGHRLTAFDPEGGADDGGDAGD